LAAVQKTIATSKLAFTDPGPNPVDGKNVLSVVVEVDCAGGEDRRICGGRVPNDVMHTLFTLMVNGERARHPRWHRPADRA
jgi:hypothetical protein